MELSQLILAGRAGMVPMARKLGNVEYFILKILETSISSKVLKKKKNQDKNQKSSPKRIDGDTCVVLCQQDITVI